MLLRANYIGEDKIYIEQQRGFSPRYAVIKPEDAKKLKINDRIEVNYINPNDIRVVKFPKAKKVEETTKTEENC
jgi:hypothetical protein